MTLLTTNLSLGDGAGGVLPARRGGLLQDVSSGWESSMKLVVISLASQALRWRAVERQFQAAGLAPRRQEAVPGEALAPWQRQRLYSEALNRRQYHRPLRTGEIGCYASHLVVWRQLLASGDHCMAVFEDDVDVAPDLASVLAAIGRFGGHWDMVKLIGRPRETPRTRSALLPGHDLIRYQRVPSLTGAYVLHRRGAEKLLAARQPFGRPIDVDMRYWWECDLDVLGVQPYPAVHAASSRDSSIGNRSAPATLPARLHKLCLQARYTLLNWRANQGFGGILPRAGEPLPEPPDNPCAGPDHAS